MCVYCEEMNAETKPIQFTEIYIGSTGFYRYHVPAVFCPFCGEKLKQKGCLVDFYAIKHKQYEYDKMNVAERNAAALTHL